MVARVFFSLGAALAALGVGAGAFGAHGLSEVLSAKALGIFETGVRYHLWHALALLATAWAVERWPSAWIRCAGWLLVAGIVIFSGSLYILALTGIGALGAVTPFGGLALISGWTALAVGVFRAERREAT